jgi:diacylglycerol kinase (ATP)
MNTATVSPLVRLWRAAYFSLSGMQVAFRTQAAFRLELLLLPFVVPVAWMLAKSAVERALLIGSWILVIIVEILNSAIEAVVDRIGLERNELSGRAKDLGSAAVFCAIALAVTVWILILAG